MESSNEQAQKEETASAVWCSLIALLAVLSVAVAFVGAGVFVQSEDPLFFAVRIVRDLAGVGIILGFMGTVLATGVVAKTCNAILSWVALGSFAFFMLTSVVVHLRHGELDPVELPISAYVLHTGEPMLVAGIYTLAFGVLAFAYRLVGAQPSSVLRHAVVCLLTVFAVGVFLLAAFPIEGYPPPEKLSTLLHFFGALGTSVPLLVLPVLQVLLLKRRLDGWFWPTMSIAAYLPLHSIVDFVSWGSPYAGLVQRIGQLFFLAVMISTSIATIRRPTQRMVEKVSISEESNADAS